MDTKYFKKLMFLIITLFFAFQFACGQSTKEKGDPLSKPAPSAPTGVIAVAGDKQITITWDSVEGATSYNIYWSTTSGVTKAKGTKIDDITGISYTHTGRINGTTYYYIVTAVNGNGESAESSVVGATPSAIGTVPSAPIGVNATAGDKQVTINWDAVSSATSYNIYWDTTLGVAKNNGIKISNVTSPYMHTSKD